MHPEIMETLSAIHETYGDASQVVKPVAQTLGNVGEAQVLIRLERAVINPSDLGMIGGSYGRLRTLPAIAGREGIGIIESVGASVKNVKVGDRVRIPEEPGVWRQYQIAEAENLLKVPNNLPADIAAMSFVNPPTALLILESFKDLKEGDWVIQNGASSALGYFLIQICKERKIKTINMVRNAAERRGTLIEAGADVVVDEAEFNPREIANLCGGKKPVLGLNQIGGESVSNMIKCMGDGGVVVTIGGMATESVKFPTRFLIFNDISLRGFWWDKWQRTHTKDEVEKVFKDIFCLIEKGVLKAPVDATFPISKVSEALARAQQNSRSGKVMLSF